MNDHTSSHILTTITAVAGLALVLSACGATDGNMQAGAAAGQAGFSGSHQTAGAGGSSAANQGQPLNDEERTDLLALREEEKLARDVYRTLGESTGIRVFANIAKAEQMHMDRVGELLTAYGLADPVTDDSTGAFTNPDFKELYNKLVAAGQSGDTDALSVGTTIEDLDIFDIEEMKLRTVHPDVLDVYDSLACGSRNHMRAFSGQLQQRNVTYEAQYISAEDLDKILAGDHETCQ